MNIFNKLSAMIVALLMVFNINIAPFEKLPIDDDIVVLESVVEWDSEW